MKIKDIMVIFLVLVSCISMADAISTYNDAYLTINLLNQDPDPADPGKYVEIRWQIEKIGNQKMENIVFELEPEYPFYFDSSDKPKKIVQSWWGRSDSDEYYTLYYKLRVDKDALEGTYEMKLRYSYDDSNNWQEEKFDIRVADKNRPEFVIGSLTTSPTKLVADTDEAQLDVELENIGDGDAQNILAELSLPQGFKPSYAYSDRDSLGTISADSSSTATFYVDIDDSVKSSIYDAVLKISYKEADDEDNEYKNIKLPLKIPINEQAIFDITDTKSIPDKIYPGNDVELRITIKNNGAKKAESTSLKAFKESSQPFTFDDKSDFIGTVEPGETGKAVLKFSVDKDAIPKDYIIDLQIRSIDGENVILQDKTLTIKVDGNAGNGPSPLIGGIVILIIIAIGIFAYMKFRKK